MTGSKLQGKSVHVACLFLYQWCKTPQILSFNPFSLSYYFLNCREKETDEKLKQLRIVLQKLPTENYNNLRYDRFSTQNFSYLPQTINVQVHTKPSLSRSIFDFITLSIRYLVQFLSHLSEQQAVNKMTPSNIAIVLGPNLLWPRCEESV